MGMGGWHYLEQELYELVQSDAEIFDFLQAGSLDGLWYWDLEKPENEWMNPRFWQILGYDPAEKSHDPKEWQDLINPDDLKVALDNFHKHCADAAHPYDQVVRYKHRSGSTVWVRCRGIAIRDADGKPTRMLGAHNELTSLKNTEARLREKIDELEHARAKLERSNQDLERFAHVTSHDLREPMRTIANFVEILAEDLDDSLEPSQRQCVGFITAAVERQQDLVTALLEYSKLQRHAVSTCDVDLAEVAQAVIDDDATAIAESNAAITLHPLPRATADPVLLRRVFHNLVTNALKYCEGPPEIVISGVVEDGMVRVTVKDTGMGFDPEFGERIFGFAERLVTASEHRGSGVGLALCRRIIGDHGGRIWAESEPGRGSSFHFTLPGAA